MYSYGKVDLVISVTPIDLTKLSKLMGELKKKFFFKSEFFLVHFLFLRITEGVEKDYSFAVQCDEPLISHKSMNRRIWAVGLFFRNASGLG